MDKETIINLLHRYRKSELSDDEMIKVLNRLPFEDLSFAKIDHHRSIRTGFPEVIYCEGKTSEQVALIAKNITESGANLLATRATEEMFNAVKEQLPLSRYNSSGKVITCTINDIKPLDHTVTIVTAGTADIPVAEETSETLTMLGLQSTLITDIGVAGIHRVLHHFEALNESKLIIVIAGMEGALASVISGMVRCPVIAVPTSVGYGTSFGGITALLGMLNSCAPGIAVMNIDNGFGAASLAFKIVRSFTPDGSQS